MERKIITFICAIFLINLLNAQSDREVIYLHGVGSGKDVWEHYDKVFEQERRIHGNNIDYRDTHSSGILGAAQEVINETTNVGNTSSNQNIAIGHSMGGLVARSMDKMVVEDGRPRRFGGIITIGTPHKGASIMSNIRVGNMKLAFENGTKKMLKGPIRSLIPIPGVSNLIGDEIIKQFNAGVKGTELDYEYYLQRRNQADKDLSLNSEFITDLNDFRHRIPMINIWGNENGQVHWRVASSFSTYNESDTELLEIARDVESVYRTIYHIYLGKTVGSTIASFGNPFRLFKAGKNAYRAAGWKEGLDWVQNSENMWLEQIGCNQEIVEKRVKYRNFNPCSEILDENILGNMRKTQQIYLQCMADKCEGDPNNCWAYDVTYHKVYVNGRSDGVVPEWSQVMDNTPMDKRFQARGVNHSEEINTSYRTTANGNDEMKDILNRIYNGVQGDNSNYFTTPRR